MTDFVAEEIAELTPLAECIAWDIDLTRETNIYRLNDVTFRLVRSVEKELRDVPNEDDTSFVEKEVDVVYWNLYRDADGESVFCVRWWESRSTPLILIVLKARAYVANDSKSRRPGTYRMSQDRVEVVCQDALGDELVTAYAVNPFLTEKVRTIFGGSTIVFQQVRDICHTQDEPLFTSNNDLRYNDNLPLLIDNNGTLSFIRMTF
jgi:hypothetical protein